MGDWRRALPKVLLRGLERAIGIQRLPVAGYVAWLRRARPDATPAEIIKVLEKQYLAAVSGTGAAVGGVAAAPGLGTVLALTLGGGETAVFLEVTTLFALAVAEVHGIRVEEVERRRTLVLAVVFGDRGAMLREKMAGRTDQHWRDLLPTVLPMSSITAVNKALGRWLLTKYGGKQSVVAIGRVAPFGTGAAIRAAGNHAFGRLVVDTSRGVFGPPPTSFADEVSPARPPA
ncbi:MAG: hypothetical protein ACRDSZ_02175 [Pseudonocardiaceae bacterium]